MDVKSLANQWKNWHCTSEYEVDLAVTATCWEGLQKWDAEIIGHRQGVGASGQNGTM